MIIVWQSILLLKKYTRKREGWGSRKTFRSFFVAFQGLSRPLSRGGKTRGHPSIALKQPIQSSAVSSRLLFNLPPGFLFSASPPPKSGVSFGFVGFFFFFFFFFFLFLNCSHTRNSQIRPGVSSPLSPGLQHGDAPPKALGQPSRPGLVSCLITAGSFSPRWKRAQRPLAVPREQPSPSLSGTP